MTNSEQNQTPDYDDWYDFEEGLAENRGRGGGGKGTKERFPTKSNRARQAQETASSQEKRAQNFINSIKQDLSILRALIVKAKNQQETKNLIDYSILKAITDKMIFDQFSKVSASQGDAL